MKILGIDTVTKVGSVAVLDNGKLLGKEIIDTNLRHAAELISAVDKLLRSVSLSVGEIGAIGVDVGPGSFTGIRVGIASVLGLAEPDDKKKIGVCSLEILARQYAANCKDADIVPFIDAKRGAVYAAFYSIRNGQIEAKKEPFLSTFNALLESIPKGGVLFGPDMDRFTVFVDGKQGILAPKENVYPQAETLATLTDEKIAKKIVQKTLEPIYIHDVILGQ